MYLCLEPTRLRPPSVLLYVLARGRDLQEVVDRVQQFCFDGRGFEGGVMEDIILIRFDDPQEGDAQHLSRFLGEPVNVVRLMFVPCGADECE